MNDLENKDDVAIASPYKDKLDVTRVIILLENQPQSNHYNQILMTQTQFKIFSDVMFKLFAKLKLKADTNQIEIEDAHFTLGRKSMVLPEDLDDYYDDDKIVRLI